MAAALGVSILLVDLRRPASPLKEWTSIDENDLWVSAYKEVSGVMANLHGHDNLLALWDKTQAVEDILNDNASALEMMQEEAITICKNT